jgi:hypothetical protein
MDDAKKEVNFTIVPADETDVSRIYSNFCAVQNTPFDFTLTFCEMLPLGEKDLRSAQETRVVEAPVRARIVLPVPMIPGLISALQENFRLYQQSVTPPGPRH